MRHFNWTLILVSVALSTAFPLSAVHTQKRGAVGFRNQGWQTASSFRRNERTNTVRNYYTGTNLQSSNNRNNQEEPDHKDEENNKDDVQISKNVFEIVWESPYFSSFLFWAPFLYNDKLRNRFTNFISEYLDLRIAIPVSVVGVIGAIVYTTYQDRLLDIELASITTDESLVQLREIRKYQMTGSSSSRGEKSIEDQYETALENYEYLLREELKLRYTFATFPVKVPNEIEGPDRAAAKQFLGMEINESGDLVKSN